jgi:hypothetical protein
MRLSTCGTLDLSKDKIPLNGEWAIYWKRILVPSDSACAFGGRSFSPKLWTKTLINGKPLSNVGYASYSLTVLLPKHQ